MAIALYDSGADYILDIVFGDSAIPEAFEVMLFVNDVTPFSGADPDLIEATGGGYARVKIGAGGIFTTVAPNPDGAGTYPAAVATAIFEDIVFPSTSGYPAANTPSTFTGGLTNGRTSVYGYAVLVDGATPCNATTGVIDNTDIIFADRLSSSFIPALGTSLTIQINFQLSKGTPT